MNESSSFRSSAYGGEGWSPRTRDHAEEVGDIWAPCGIDSEWMLLKSVLLHRPGKELVASADPRAVQMFAPLDLALAREQHDAMAQAYRTAGVAVHHVEPDEAPPPNQMFCADLVFMTREGAILARPASTVRAGEERRIARRLAELGVPILRTLTGTAVFEGADAMWLDPETVLVGLGLRSNAEAAAQIAQTLELQEADVLPVDLPFGTMHLMGLLRIVDRDLAIAWPRRTPHAVVAALRERGIEVAFLPDEAGDRQSAAFNFVTLGPRRVLMADTYPEMSEFLERLGVDCTPVRVTELAKAAGGIGCMSAVLHREPVDATA